MFRHAIRLKQHDYRSPRVYLVTTVTDHRSRCLGCVLVDGVALSPLGRVVERHCALLPKWRPQVSVVDHVVMPDHVHLLLRFEDYIPSGLGAVVGSWKAGITREINVLRGTPTRAFWQENYWERVVRNDRELEGFRRYIRANPRSWLSKYGSG